MNCECGDGFSCDFHAKIEREAERYRYLRSKAKRASVLSRHHAGDIQVIQWVDRTEANVLAFEFLDAAIDAAMKEGK